MEYSFMHIIKTIFTLLGAILLSMLIYMSIHIINDGKQARILKTDYAILHSTAYGMFNADIWTQKVTKIIDHKIENFDLNKDNREEIKGYIQTIIDTLVLEAERVVRERNKGKRGFFDSLIGSTKQMITDSIIDFKDLRKRVPEFTNAVMSEVEKPENQARAKAVLRDKLKAFMKEKFKHTTDMKAYYAVIQKYHTTDVQACTTILDQNIHLIHTRLESTMSLMLGITFIIILLILGEGSLHNVSLIILSATTITLLVSGIMLPMLDIEAKIAQLSFTILDKPIVFENQILFFQSKSISDLVHLLLESDKIKMKFVGILLVMFSIIFPTLKLIATYLYYYSKNRIANNPITRFFALRSTKWSMADVMVVSIFMAYLGLDGVVSNELKHLESKATPMNIITTNGSHLEVGFFLFLGFVLTSFVLSILVEKHHKDI